MEVKHALKNDLLLKVAKGEAVSRPPVWLMRQAGRFLSEYRAVRKEAGSFRNMIAQPDYAIEVTLQPVDLVGVDAAIIFSDILVIPEAMGLPYQMIPGKGPFFEETIQSERDLDRLHAVQDESNLDHTYQAIEGTIAKLEGRVPLIGFAGAPWTIFSYMVEGSGSKTFSKAKAMLYRNPELSHKLLQKITDATITYLKGQIKAGVHIVQIFDSWAGVLDAEMYAKFAIPYIRQICAAIQEVPKIVFAKGAYFSLVDLASLDCQVLGLDWQMAPEAVAQLAPEKALQGNLDPCQIYADPESVKAATIEMLNRFPKGRHIANLGHGIYPDLPREHVLTFVETVKSFSYL
ncbi:uroporphyrinogen decarboxylase [Pontibacter sp. G13]|uniref:uroporphyrinogen decarboxylase n=1 Tax=Pontibacter sp. G13 TaxID=3074898 RepID=UPI00288BE3E0|nr:uroporphyrinogen decarboxylase [Pontibacter sp. G13]WNJ20849.1 uroporphyrinogen decarboxylase [Pontibacter sp. G13]